MKNGHKRSPFFVMADQYTRTQTVSTALTATAGAEELSSIQ